ncbi:hypothetical protein [Streptomyces sp. RerS4]|uniref:hypothetical protein n=1 Tax=Streptomyces sp. RerS4 TaxID=2942449 RepID=UPI00201C9731|nr:hypothetical protein [Streptomyces sp. RerS4]UQX03070.1 hypothetical protein M4D82_23160 [Streptomyces sp. RerS4]
MRLRTTAAALLASLALVVPTAGTSLADDHDRDLGELHYRFADDEGDVRRATIHPGDNDTCYRLTHTGRNRSAFEVKNDTESLALLFEGSSCGGNPQEILAPGERARDLDVRSVFFKPTDDDDDHGHHGRHDDDDWDDRDDWSDDDRSRSRGRVGGQQGRSSLQDRAMSESGIFGPVTRSMR